jgi:hypothetical protein
VVWLKVCNVKLHQVLSSYLCTVQKFAAFYKEVIFLKFFGNSNENTKHLFKERLATPLTPSYTYWRNGMPKPFLKGGEDGHSLQAPGKWLFGSWILSWDSQQFSIAKWWCA